MTVEPRIIDGTVLRDATLSELAALVTRDWKSVYFGARPYLAALGTLKDLTEKFGADSAEEVVNYFLANAQTWRGAVAKAVKNELRARLTAHAKANPTGRAP